jgi:hypothetical protein
VLKNRPNVYPVYTNSSDVDDEEDSIVMSTHSNLSDGNEDATHVKSGMNTNNEVEVVDVDAISVITVTNERNTLTPVKKDVEKITGVESNYSNSATKLVNTSSISDITVCDTPTSSENSTKTKSTKSMSANSKTTNNSSKKLSPLKAKNMLKSQLRENKQQIHGSNKVNNMNMSYRQTEEEDRLYMRECRKKKLEMEEKQHYDMLLETKEKRKLEQRRLEMDLRSNELKQEQINIEKRNSKIRQQTDAIVCEQEKNKLLLIKMKVYQQRKELEKDNPEISDNFWDCDVQID